MSERLTYSESNDNVSDYQETQKDLNLLAILGEQNFAKNQPASSRVGKQFEPFASYDVKDRRELIELHREGSLLTIQGPKDKIPVDQNLEKRLAALDPSAPEAQRLLRQLEEQREKHLVKMKEYIRDHGTHATDGLVKLAKDKTVITIGESHDRAPDKNRELVASSMQRLHDQAGVTHYAVELPEALQPIVDAYQKKPMGHKLDLSALVKEPGVLPADAKQAKSVLDLVAGLQLGVKSYLSTIEAAHAAGIKVRCVDSNVVLLPQGESEKTNEYKERDQHLSKRILDIIEVAKAEGGTAKVMYLGGFNHVVSTSSTTMTDLLKDKMPGQVATVFTMGWGPGDHPFATFPLVFSLQQPVGIALRGNGNPFTQLPFMSWRMPGEQRTSDKFLGNFDYALLYPEPPARPRR